MIYQCMQFHSETPVTIAAASETSLVREAGLHLLSHFPRNVCVPSLLENCHEDVTHRRHRPYAGAFDDSHLLGQKTLPIK
jgi:hypothetical protein